MIYLKMKGMREKKTLMDSHLSKSYQTTFKCYSFFQKLLASLTSVGICCSLSSSQVIFILSWLFYVQQRLSLVMFKGFLHTSLEIVIIYFTDKVYYAAIYVYATMLNSQVGLLCSMYYPDHSQVRMVCSMLTHMVCGMQSLFTSL